MLQVYSKTLEYYKHYKNLSFSTHLYLYVHISVYICTYTDFKRSTQRYMYAQEEKYVDTNICIQFKTRNLKQSNQTLKDQQFK